VVAAGAWAVTGERMGGMDAGPGTELRGLGWFAAVWVTMMAAMMLPSIAPMVVAHPGVRIGATPAFVAGYLLTWGAVGLLGCDVKHGIKTLTKSSTVNLSLDRLIHVLNPRPAWMGQLLSPRREQPLLCVSQPLPVVADDPLAAQEATAADLETDQATVLGAQLDRPQRREARLARRGSCGEPDARERARPVRRAGRGNGPAVTPAPRPVPTQRGDAEVGMPQLPLNDVERHALVGEVDGVGVAQLVGREPPPHAGRSIPAYDWRDEPCWPGRVARVVGPDLNQTACSADAVGDGVAAASGRPSCRRAGAQARVALRSRGVG
jgi:hypothetical protein